MFQRFLDFQNHSPKSTPTQRWSLTFIQRRTNGKMSAAITGETTQGETSLRPKRQRSAGIKWVKGRDHRARDPTRPQGPERFRPTDSDSEIPDTKVRERCGTGCTV